MFSPDPYALIFALLLELLDKPIWWKGHLVTPLIHPALHPVSLIYRLGAPFVKPGGITRGVAVLLIVATPMTAAAVLFRFVRGGELWWSLAEGYLLKFSFSITHVTYGCIEAYASGCPHGAVKEFVRRPLSPRDRWLINSACVETAAESLVDSYISPLMWYLLLGLPGAWLQRAVNTADGLIGFKEFGPAGAPAAVLDTAMNYLPARATAAFLLMFGIRCVEALGQEVGSVNAKWPISAIAAAMGVRLEKSGHYAVGCGTWPTEVEVAHALWLIDAIAAYVGALFITAALAAAS